MEPSSTYEVDKIVNSKASYKCLFEEKNVVLRQFKLFKKSITNTTVSTDKSNTHLYSYWFKVRVSLNCLVECIFYCCCI